MPAFETMDLKQDAVLWEANGYDSEGEAKVNAPIAIKVRWENTSTFANNPQDNLEDISAIVFVDRLIPAQSILWLGKLADLPDTPVNLKKVVSSEWVSDIKNRNTRYTLQVVNSNALLPELNS